MRKVLVSMDDTTIDVESVKVKKVLAKFFSEEDFYMLKMALQTLELDNYVELEMDADKVICIKIVEEME